MFSPLLASLSRSVDRRPLPWLLLVWALALAIPFRAAIFGGFDWLLGDRGDTIIEIALLEHWRGVLLFGEAWNAPLYFDPYRDTLGYNDGYLLPGMIYTALRGLLDPFRAQIGVAMLLKSIGFLGAYWLVARTLKWGGGIALLVALLLTIGNGMYVQSGHGQIQTLALLPWAAILLTGTWRAEAAGEARRAILCGVGAVALIGVWLVSAFYFAWFTLYFSLVLLLGWAWLGGKLNRAGLALVWHHRVTLGAMAGAALLCWLPFLLVYLPKVVETGGHHFVLSYTAYPTDTFNAGDQNLLWGWVIGALRWLAAVPWGAEGAEKMLGGEHRSGLPLFLFVLTCMAAWRLLRQRGDAGFARAFALALVVSWALILRLGPVSPWILVHSLVPGASGLRVVLRYQLFLALPALLLVAYVYRARLAALWSARPAAAALVVLLLVAEQINLAPVARVDRREHLAALGAVPAPPPGCSRFYVVTARRGEAMYVNPKLDGLYPHNVDAMLLAELWRVPTLNGYSTFNPPDWNFADPKAPDYDARVMAYARKHGLTGLCRLDMRDPAPWRRIG